MTPLTEKTLHTLDTNRDDWLQCMFARKPLHDNKTLLKSYSVLVRRGLDLMMMMIIFQINLYIKVQFELDIKSKNDVSFCLSFFLLF